MSLAKFNKDMPVAAALPKRIERLNDLAYNLWWAWNPEIIPSGLTKFNFSDNGSASVECALKMSFQYMYQTGRPERTRFMCLDEGYHGETIGALSVGAMDLYEIGRAHV